MDVQRLCSFKSLRTKFEFEIKGKTKTISQTSMLPLPKRFQAMLAPHSLGKAQAKGLDSIEIAYPLRCDDGLTR